MQKLDVKRERKRWIAPRAKRLASGSAEFGTSPGADGSGTS